MNDHHLPVPQHLAIIMDGNGRWAKQRGMPRIAGHRAGLEATRRIIRECGEQGVKTLTLFAFGMENWRRPAIEVNHLMQLFSRALDQEITSLHENNVQFKVIGELTRLSTSLQKKIYHAQNLTAANTGLQLIIAMSYSGQWDVMQACRKLMEKAINGELTPDQLTAELLNAHLATSGLPGPDLLIRTSGECRISNFMLWQLAYTELYFSPVYWPDFTGEELKKAFRFYQHRERRFGRTSEQILEQLMYA